MDHPTAAAEVVQRAAGVIAARHRGDLDGAEALLASFPSEQARTLGFYLLADLALGFLRVQTGQSTEDLVQELSLHVATAANQPPTPG
ncbi:superoxide dismutase [Micromonospora sp. RTGN7]|uniref:superoxide dismutase n=1 Tax=Micromonospora sp. RTGN7 TaxID=3016526 RepID=UPI0029FF2383|nr:superoxide dismutase [Micromonospora sp. RTGN7]